MKFVCVNTFDIIDSSFFFKVEFSFIEGEVYEINEIYPVVNELIIMDCEYEYTDEFGSKYSFSEEMMDNFITISELRDNRINDILED